MRWDSNPNLLPFRQFIHSCKSFNFAYSLRCASKTPHSLSKFIAVPLEQSCTILKHTNRAIYSRGELSRRPLKPIG